MWILIALMPAAAFLLGFFIGLRIMIVRYIPVEESKLKTSDLYPSKGQDGPTVN